MSKHLIKFVFLLASASIALTPIDLGAEGNSSSGPPDGRTGAPAEGLCTDCHGGTANSGDGSLQIIAPDFVLSGSSFPITVQLNDPAQSRWGFELTAVDENGDGIGIFTLTDPANTQLSENTAPARDYVKHTSDGTYAGTSGPAIWQVSITVENPLIDMGGFDFTIYAAGNAADNNGSSSGDNIYTAEKRISVNAPGIPSSSPIGLIAITALIVMTAFYILTRRRLVKR